MKKVVSSSPFWRHVSILLVVIVVIQWFMFVSLLEPGVPLATPYFQQQQQQQQIHPRQLPSELQPASSTNSNGGDSVVSTTGVAVTVMLRAPKWFHRRYTVMLHNVLANIPTNWMVQVFVNEDWFQRDVLPLHPGMQRLRSKDNDRILWTPLPKNMTKFKPKDVMKSRWLWNSIIAENVLLFGGNGAMCANSHYPISRFLEFDYVGSPWGQQHGRGGDGSSHSFRHRSAMLEVLDYGDDSRGDQDYQFFLKAMIKNEKRFKIADKETTIAFGGGANDQQTPLLLSGTQNSLNWTERENILFTCPELKTIFPSLHEPSCFGARSVVNGEKCKSTICALQDEIPGKGC